MAGNTDKAEIRSEICQHVYDLARMAHQPLSGEALQQFLTRSSALMARLI